MIRMSFHKQKEMKHVRSGRRRSRQRGATLAIGIAWLWVLVILLVFFVFYVINVCMAFYYQQRVSYAAHQGAVFAASLYHWYHGKTGIDDPRVLTIPMVKRLLKTMGIAPPASAEVAVNRDPPSGDPITGRVICTVTIKGLVLPGQGNLPAYVDFQAKQSADLEVGQPPAILVLRSKDHPEENVCLPAYGKYPTPSEDPNASDVAHLRNFGYSNHVFSISPPLAEYTEVAP